MLSLQFFIFKDYHDIFTVIHLNQGCAAVDNDRAKFYMELIYELV